MLSAHTCATAKCPQRIYQSRPATVKVPTGPVMGHFESLGWYCEPMLWVVRIKVTHYHRALFLLRTAVSAAARYRDRVSIVRNVYRELSTMIARNSSAR